MPAINELLQQGRYRIIQPLGQNGMGASYEAFDTVDETKVLFKEISVNLRKVTTLTQQEALKRRFADEAKILTGIKHESLLSVRGYFSEIDRHYLVMEMVEGNYLSELIEKDKKAFALADAANWAEQLLDALHYLHTQTPPVIHRDIKPQNVKLTADGKIKLALSVQNPDTKANEIITNQNLHYLPLEQIWVGLDSASQKVILNSYDEKSERILEQPADAKSDIYALGATLYYLLTARLPVDALERSIYILEGKSDPLTRPEQLNPSISPEISDILMKALEIKRENRFDSAVIMRQAWRTAFVRIKEREALKTKKADEDVLEIPFAEQKPPHQQPVAQKNLQTEADKARELELIKRRLQEVEAQRLKAEQRAAEAEKRLAEKQSEVVSDDAAAAAAVTIPELPRDFVKAASATAASAAPDVVAYSAEVQTADEFQGLFSSAATPKDNKVFRRMFAVAASLVILGGAFWGVWVLLKSKSIEANPTPSSPTMSLTDTTKPATSVETAAPTPSAETTPETSAIETTSVPADSTEPTTASPAIKNKPVAPPPAARVKKPTLPATKPAEKKAVTVDDIINDNN